MSQSKVKEDICVSECVFAPVENKGTHCFIPLWGRKAQLELVAVFPETGSDAGQATLNSSAGFMVSKVDGVGSRPPPSSSTRTLLASDKQRTLAAQTNPCHAH
ncbi:hypothetical protein CesoFtcFv8_012215 [Champsocephalus esox]|uniref:Uncharacterized protein n=1 Tax=Champsocephalus esox TaxID=159716 RepID=A0AAN8GVD1_9TELE|nr:hypothetical protein CesoFtcFv8_012215 [Champsocephalus esox]